MARLFRARAAVILILISSIASSQRAESQTTRNRVAAVYILLGGLTGATGHAFQHKPIWKGFLEGAAGGAVVMGGKCLIAKQSHSNYWFGRTAVGIGTSLIANALSAKPPLQRIAVPVGPLVLEQNFKTQRTRTRVSLAAAATSAWFFISPDKTFSPGETMKHDVMTFEDDNADLDYEGGGVIILRQFYDNSVFAHELIHVSQTDFVSLAWGEPLQEWIAPKIPLANALNTYVDFNILQPIWAAVSTRGEIWDRPWEKEARFFSFPQHLC